MKCILQKSFAAFSSSQDERAFVTLPWGRLQPSEWVYSDLHLLTAAQVWMSLCWWIWSGKGDRTWCAQLPLIPLPFSSWLYNLLPTPLLLGMEFICSSHIKTRIGLPTSFYIDAMHFMAHLWQFVLAEHVLCQHKCRIVPLVDQHLILLDGHWEKKVERR